eukprot:CAMPEP_0119551132 /NCGR_PEP_ID=MMETSP1352-20130426/4475_1 /TAXON_ID=265584 /ORGANISM="Stauroneis constricta, Strain CCMP1120" /LENGTH=528 /DNA_ID=CAMNT_0007597141 /DNA_START=65 /DNA_END=1651 /DNA_ORIENTATION=+
MHGQHDALEHFLVNHVNAASEMTASKTKSIEFLSSEKNGSKDKGKHNLLDCSEYGGPYTEKETMDVVYWKDIPSDSQYVSPFYDPSTVKYLSFEPDGGGWNNIRMSMETVLAIAVATGRTLVLPPSQQMYLLHGKTFSFADFFPLEEIAAEHEGLEVITMQQFLERTMGQWRDKSTGEVSFPPGKRTNWDGQTSEVKFKLNPWLQSVSLHPEWDNRKCLAVFPESSDPAEEQRLEAMLQQALEGSPTYKDFIGKPHDVDASAVDRLKESLAGRDQLCIYNQEMQQAPFIHFSGKRSMPGGRLLVHFYAFLFFQDWKQDLWMKRFVRDHVHYIDVVQCTAARVVAAVRERARQNGEKDGIFDSFHIRRGDFQYKKTRIPASQIYDISNANIPEGATVYVGTDERDKSFFDDMAKHYKLLFLDDFKDLLGGIDKNYYGMIDQIVTSRGRTFFGCWFSTFTGYINRMRGYYADRDHMEGYEMGLIESYYYVLAQNRDTMREFYPIKQAFYSREFPASWRYLDYGVAEEEIN